MYVYRQNIHLPRKKTIVINRLQVRIKKYCNVPLCLSTCTNSVHVHLYINIDRKWSWNASREHEVDAKWLWHCTAQAFSEHHTCHMHTNKPQPRQVLRGKSEENNQPLTKSRLQMHTFLWALLSHAWDDGNFLSPAPSSVSLLCSSFSCLRMRACLLK